MVHDNGIFRATKFAGPLAHRRDEINILTLLFVFPSSLSPPRGASQTPSMVPKTGVTPLLFQLGRHLDFKTS